MMEEMKLILMVLMSWMPGQPDRDTQIQFRYHRDMAQCEQAIAQEKQALRAQHGEQLLVRGLCLTEDDLERLEPPRPSREEWEEHRR